MRKAPKTSKGQKRKGQGRFKRFQRHQSQQNSRRQCSAGCHPFASSSLFLSPTFISSLFSLFLARPGLIPTSTVWNCRTNVFQIYTTMLRGRFNYPDLDVLDSPLISPNPLGLASAFGSSIPGSAIAERIFNDPESWEENDGDEDDLPVDVDQLAWLTEEIEKFKAGVDPVKLPFDGVPHTPTDKHPQLLPSPMSGRGSLTRRDTWKSIGKKTGMRPISLAALFEHSNEDFSSDIQRQLSKILESGGIPHHIRPFPPSSALSPPSTSGSSSTLDTPAHPHTASTNGGDSSPSPVNIYSASATLSFLEWYGIYPDSPRLDINGRRTQPKSARIKAPLLQVPSPRHATPPSSLLNTPIPATTFVARPDKRASSVPPPGLDPPASTASPPLVEAPVQPRRVSKSPSPIRSNDRQPAARKDSTPQALPALPLSDTSERGRGPHMTSPPPSYTRSPSPQVVRSNPTSTVPSREGTPSRQGRRLPTIPSESSSRPPSPPEPAPQQKPQVAPLPQPLPQPQVQSQPVTLTRAQSQPQRSNLPRHASPARVASVPATTSASVSSVPNGQQDVPRPPSVRSPLGGPAGPRTRSRTSHDVGARRPPVLRI